MSDWPPGPPGSGRSTVNEPRAVSSSPLVRSEPPVKAPSDGTQGGVRPTGGTHSLAAVLTPGPPPAFLIRLDTTGRPELARLADWSAATAADAAARSGVRQVWIGPAMLQFLRLPTHGWAARDLPQWYGSALAAGWELTPGARASWLELKRQDQRLEFVVPSWDTDNPFRLASSTGELLEALELFAQLLRLRYRYSPGATGLALMRAVHSGPGAVALPEVGTPAPPAVKGYDGHAAGSWCADALPGEGWLHAFDLNGMYLAAASSASLGFGEPVNVKHPTARWAPGFYRCHVGPSLAGRVPDIPPPFKVDGRPHWYSAPAVSWMAERGCPVHALEGWIYPESKRWLEPWYERLRRAREAAMEPGRPARLITLAALKRVYTASLGRLGGRWMQAGDSSFRPDWRLTVIDRALANMYRHLHAAQTLPLGRDADLAVWWSSEADPMVAAAQLGLEVSDQLGKWKPAGKIAAREAQAAVAGKKSGAGRIRALIEAMA